MNWWMTIACDAKLSVFCIMLDVYAGMNKNMQRITTTTTNKQKTDAEANEIMFKYMEKKNLSVVNEWENLAEWLG